ncbi:MAG: DUF86 domain-containing protein [Syntrophales bacterium]|nr:DUF86 domain-containing protein [Syntrophales bacterium]MDD5642679.1 DUF86 domain-containing protein [Syntrophales bacterium]
MRDVLELLADILEAIQHIEKYTRQGRGRFDADELVQSWVIRHLQILGEAARKLPPEIKERHPEIPWSKIIGMRHILTHDYFDIDAEVVWAAVEKDLPKLKKQIEVILKQ